MIRWLLLSAFILASCANFQNTANETKHGQRFIASSEKWAVSGYLADKPKEKVYVVISRGQIDSVSTSKPSGVEIVDTNAIIFPGFMDMHSHVKYNILPLWDLAQSQFLNRFEWRSKFSDYKDAVSANMRGVRGDTVCAAVRWAEIKAMAGGATAIQGIGGDSKCARGFGINNIEIPEDFNDIKFRSMTDMIMPDLLGSVFQKYIEPNMKKGMNYEKAYKQMLDDNKVTSWVEFFVKENHTVGNGLKLLIGNDFGLERSTSQSDFRKAEKEIAQYLSGPPYNASEKDIEKQMIAMETWIFGKGSDSYLKARKDEKKAYDYLSKGGVLTVPSSIRRYIGMFETSVRESALNYYKTSGPKAIVAHLSEGMRKDAYNKLEYAYAKKLDLTKKGLVVIHGVGLSTSDLRDAARNDISIVWSPFSNLLLYGETLDVKAAKAAGVNIAIGVDWTPTGSKHILDELNLARRYLDHIREKSISNKDLVEMATVNAAKALQMEKQIGKVERGYNANLTLLSCKGDPYDCAVNADQSQVELIVVNGQGLYGEPSHIEKLAKVFGDRDEPESLPRSNKCSFKKAIRFLPPTDFDRKASGYRSVPDLEKHLDAALRKSESRKQKASLDPLFNCEDDKYTKRFAEYIEKELDRNNRSRSSSRSAAKLDSKWTPFTLDDASTEEQEE
ncbi:MAG: amidohydrolase family protein [Oligoflexia bacterium]|nr:amidohydrolase family protein [Oligoflexia bacterium]